jgi:hypothetical protein
MALKEQGVPNNGIAERLSISLATVGQDLKAMRSRNGEAPQKKAHGSTQDGTRKAYMDCPKPSPSTPGVPGFDHFWHSEGIDPRRFEGWGYCPPVQCQFHSARRYESEDRA